MSGKTIERYTEELDFLAQCLGFRQSVSGYAVTWIKKP